jgi:hypothetical protein
MLAELGYDLVVLPSDAALLRDAVRREVARLGGTESSADLGRSRPAHRH